MADDDQQQPLAPTPKPHVSPPLSADEALSLELKHQHKRFHNRTICCGIITAIILILAVVMLVLGFTVFHVKNPRVNLNSVSITGLDRVNSTGRLARDANLTVVADVSVKNPNVAAFKFEGSDSSLVYRGTVVGVAEVPGGVAEARRTVRLNVTYAVAVAEVAGNRQFGGDFAAGVLPVESYTKIEGRVKILKIVKRKVTVSLNCSITVNISSMGIVDQSCNKHVSVRN